MDIASCLTEFKVPGEHRARLQTIFVFTGTNAGSRGEIYVFQSPNDFTGFYADCHGKRDGQCGACPGCDKVHPDRFRYTDPDIYSSSQVHGNRYIHFHSNTFAHVNTDCYEYH